MSVSSLLEFSILVFRLTFLTSTQYLFRKNGRNLIDSNALGIYAYAMHRDFILSYCVVLLFTYFPPQFIASCDLRIANPN